MHSKKGTLDQNPNNGETCRRCGTCCRNGGPALHTEDMETLEKGKIALKHLYTIRRNEPVRDNVKGCISPAGSEIIKLKGQKEGWTCRMFDDASKGCRIYENRPVECRVLTCWDTRELESIYSENRLSRKDLLLGIEGLWDLIESHEERCAYDRLQRRVDSLAGFHREQAAEDILQMLKYDKHLRLLVVEKAGMDPGMSDFLFGRPLMKTVPLFGIQIERQGDKIILKR